MTYLITGGTGFVGQELIANLLQSKQKIIVLSRDKNKVRKLFDGKVRAISSLREISDDEAIDNIINLAGEPIANKKWTEQQKEILLNSRLTTTRNIVQLIADLKTKPKILISSSAIGFYGSRGDEELNEYSKCGDEFTSHLCKKWEDEANKASEFGVRVCITRLGIVLGKNGGALSKMLPAFKLGLGGKMGTGNQFMSFVHVDDVVLAINFLIKNEELVGIFNLTAPSPVKNHQFTNTLGKILQRPTFFNMPEFIIQILFGKMGEALLLKGQKVLPKRLLDAGYKFSFLDLESSLENIIKK